MSSRSPRRRIEPDPFRGPTWSDRWILPYVREPTLWPVLLVVIAHGVAFLAPLLLLAARDGRTGAAATLTALGVGSGVLAGREWSRHGRPGGLGVLLAATWLLSGAGAVVAHRTGIF